MECDICGNAGGLNCPLRCITCARSAIEAPRIELAKALIERDGVARHVTAVIEGSQERASQQVSLKDSKGGFLVDRQECTNNIELQRTKAETAEVEERIQLITEQADLLRQQMEVTKRLIEEKRALNEQKKSDLSSATYGIDSRRANELDKVQQNVKRMDYKSDKVHHDTIEMRISLCTTAARLAGLKTQKRKTKDGGVKDIYCIGPGTRMRIFDLRDMSDAPPDHLSASLAAVANLLVRVAAYLGVRLPAEITPPHKDYPQPTIFSPTSSYQGKKVPFPGTTPSHSSSNSPEASRTLDPRIHLPKPRALFIDRPLYHLYAEDPPAYSSFVEGVSLLAYNVAWLCRTQGMKDEFKVWEDVCPMGPNLYRLLIAQETHHPQRPENPLDKDIVATKTNSKAPLRRAPVAFGELSHATSHSFLNTAENVQYLSGWGLSPTKIIDETKAYLLGEQQNREWDIIPESEMEQMENLIAEDPILIGARRQDNAGLDDGRSYLTSTISNRQTPDPRPDDKKRGVNGWTKLKSRNEEGAKRTAE